MPLLSVQNLTTAFQTDEGLLTAVDGAKSAPNSQQFLNGGDSASYTVTASAGVCVKSSSGKLGSGVCR